MFLSKIVPVKKIQLPKFKQTHLYMHEIDLSQKVNLPNEFKDYESIAQKMIDCSPVKEGIAWITIDNKFVSKGRTHRRGGPHVDGNYNYDWGGNGWKTGDAGRYLPEKEHKEQYGSSFGGMLIVSSYPACKAWVGKYDVLANQGGDCSHFQDKLESMDSFVLDPNTIYLANSTCIHESLPLDQDVERSMIRITLPNTKSVF